MNKHLLAEALTTHGKALARLKQTHVAKSTLDHAIQIAQTAGSLNAGGIAAVTAIEELNLIYQLTLCKITTAPLSRCLRTRRTAVL